MASFFREPNYGNNRVIIDPTPMPKDIPYCPEVGASSAPLASASFFIGDRCKAYNEDFMLCKEENRERDPKGCFREGRRVTRCAIGVIQDINATCAEQFKIHWQCLENSNHRFNGCRPAELALNKCVFDKLKLEKTIPGTPKGKQPIHLKTGKQYYPGEEDPAGLDIYKKEFGKKYVK